MFLGNIDSSGPLTASTPPDARALSRAWNYLSLIWGLFCFHFGVDRSWPFSHNAIIWPFHYGNGTLLDHLFLNVMWNRTSGYFSKVRKKSRSEIENKIINKNRLFQKASDSNVTQLVQSPIQRRCATYNTRLVYYTNVCYPRSQLRFD